MILKGTANRLQRLGPGRRRAQRRKRNQNLLIGATVGTAAGAIVGVLFAPQSGRKTRRLISQRTGEAIDSMRERVSDTGEKLAEQIQERTSRLRGAAQTCVESAKEEPEASKEDGRSKPAKKK